MESLDSGGIGAHVPTISCCIVASQLFRANCGASDCKKFIYTWCCLFGSRSHTLNKCREFVTPMSKKVLMWVVNVCITSRLMCSLFTVYSNIFMETVGTWSQSLPLKKHPTIYVLNWILSPELQTQTSEQRSVWFNFYADRNTPHSCSPFQVRA